MAHEQPGAVRGRAANSMQFKRFSPVDDHTRARLYPLFGERRPSPA